MNCIYIVGGVYKIQLLLLFVNWDTVIDLCLIHTECFATTPKASQNKQLFITGEMILKSCLLLPILAHSMWAVHTCVSYDMDVGMIKIKYSYTFCGFFTNMYVGYIARISLGIHIVTDSLIDVKDADDER